MSISQSLCDNQRAPDAIWQLICTVQSTHHLLPGRPISDEAMSHVFVRYLVRVGPNRSAAEIRIKTSMRDSPTVSRQTQNPAAEATSSRVVTCLVSQGRVSEKAVPKHL